MGFLSSVWGDVTDFILWQDWLLRKLLIPEVAFKSKGSFFSVDEKTERSQYKVAPNFHGTLPLFLILRLRGKPDVVDGSLVSEMAYIEFHLHSLIATSTRKKRLKFTGSKWSSWHFYPLWPSQSNPRLLHPVSQPKQN